MSNEIHVDIERKKGRPSVRMDVKGQYYGMAEFPLWITYKDDVGVLDPNVKVTLYTRKRYKDSNTAMTAAKRLARKKVVVRVKP